MILQVVTADQNPRIFAHADVDLGDFRIAVGRGIGFIQQGHGGNGRLPGFHHQSNHFIHGQRLGGGCQGFHDEVIDFCPVKSENRRMVRIGGNSLQTDG